MALLGTMKTRRGRVSDIGANLQSFNTGCIFAKEFRREEQLNVEETVKEYRLMTVCFWFHVRTAQSVAKDQQEP